MRKVEINLCTCFELSTVNLGNCYAHERFPCSIPKKPWLVGFPLRGGNFLPCNDWNQPVAKPEHGAVFSHRWRLKINFLNAMFR